MSQAVARRILNSLDVERVLQRDRDIVRATERKLARPELLRREHDRGEVLGGELVDAVELEELGRLGERRRSIGEQRLVRQDQRHAEALAFRAGGDEREVQLDVVLGHGSAPARR